MKSNVLPNGGICQHRKVDDSFGLVLVFSSFSNDDTILAIPLDTLAPDVSIPFLVGGNLMYISYCDMFRVRKSELHSVIGHMDGNAVEMVTQAISDALKGGVVNIFVPSAVLFNDEKPATVAANTEDLSKPTAKCKYSYEDYLFIANNYGNNTDAILSKYNLKTKRDAYRLKYDLGKRFGEANGNGTLPEPDKTSQEDKLDGG